MTLAIGARSCQQWNRVTPLRSAFMVHHQDGKGQTDSRALTPSAKPPDAGRNACPQIVPNPTGSGDTHGGACKSMEDTTTNARNCQIIQ